ncbi:MAG: hypothetical protein R6X18_13715 [Chloroflexota bacterium]|jgi:hypothetical protein
MIDRFAERWAAWRQSPPAWLFPLVVVLVALVAAWPAVSQPGLLNTRGGGDSPFLLQRLHQLVAALTDGHFPVRWMPDANYGYGYPFYNYYAPLSIYISAIFRFMGLTFVRSIHAAQLLGFVVAGLGMFYLGRRWLGSPWAGLLAAVAYTVAPFHMVNVYVRGDSLAEFWAMAFYPLVLLAADSLLEVTASRGQPVANRMQWPVIGSRLAFFALAYAALILSHNISALIFSPFLLLYLILRLWQENREEETQRKERQSLPLRCSAAPLFAILAALALAFALAAWFFVPALAEQDLAQLGPVTEGYFHFSNHFRDLDLIQSNLLFDYSPDGGVAFRMGMVQAGLALAGAIVFIWRRQSVTRSRLLFILAGALIATTMITSLSRVLWEYLPLLSFTQFPWRFLSVQALFIALLTGALALWPGRHMAPLMAAAASLVLLAGALLGLRTDHLTLTDADVTAERLAQYEWFTGNIGSTVSAEYLPPEAQPRPYTSPWLNTNERDRVVALDGSLESAAVSRRATRQEWAVTTGGQGATLLFPTLFWPGWQTTIDGEPADLQAQPGSGLMLLEVPAGSHEIDLILERTPVRRVAEWVSLAAALVAIFLLLAGNWDRLRAGCSSPWIINGLVLLGILIVAIVGRLRPAFNYPESDMTWDFAQMGYLHHDPAGVSFDNGAKLFSYGYSNDTLAAGDTLIVTLSLLPGAGQTTTLDLATPATARPTSRDVAEPPLLASQTRPLDGGPDVVFTLPISRNAPAGLYVPRLTIDEARPLMPSGQTRGDLFLRPVRVVTGDEPIPVESVAAPFSWDVRALALVEREPLILDGQFAWLPWQPAAQRYHVSWRVQDATGAILSQLDTQPGYGFQPTDGWPAGEPSYDWLALRLPNTLSGPAPYPLVIILYDPLTGEPILQRRLGELVAEEGGPVFRSIKPVFTSPENITSVNASFAVDDQPTIWLQGYDLERMGDMLRLALHWQAMAAMNQDYTRFVHLIDATGAIVAQVDGHVTGNSYPTSQWVNGEVISDVVEFELPADPGEQYQLATGFYRPVEGLPRLVARDEQGDLPDAQVIIVFD